MSRRHSIGLLRDQDTNRSQEKCLRTKVSKCFVPLHHTVEPAFWCNHWFSAKTEGMTVSCRHSISLLRDQDTNRCQEKCVRTKVSKCV